MKKAKKVLIEEEEIFVNDKVEKKLMEEGKRL